MQCPTSKPDLMAIAISIQGEFMMLQPHPLCIPRLRRIAVLTGFLRSQLGLEDSPVSDDGVEALVAAFNEAIVLMGLHPDAEA